MRDYGKLEWTSNGKAIWCHRRYVPCTGPDWSDKCLGRWEDEYGSAHWCPTCVYGNGEMLERRTIRVPRYDAPKPPPSWKGPGKKAVEKAYAS